MLKEVFFTFMRCTGIIHVFKYVSLRAEVPDSYCFGLRGTGGKESTTCCLEFLSYLVFLTLPPPITSVKNK